MIQGELTTLGLGRTEERAYRALLSEQADGAAELARQLGLERTRLDAALGRLVEHGFAHPADPYDAEALPRPAAPAAAIRTLIHRRQEELHLRSAELERLRRTAERLEPRTVPAGGVETVTGRPAIAERADRLLAGAEREVLVLDRPPYVRAGIGCTEPGGRAPDWAALLDRGVTVRVVLDRAGLGLPGRAAALAALAARGLRVRVATGVPTKLIAVDRRVTLLPPSDAADPRAAALVVGDALLRNALVPLFEAVWERADPLAERREEGGEQRELLALLASGLKDEAIARRLGVHVHTARRRISRLLEVLDARTRFQAGARARQRGWLD
ncbi:hypothetical protein NX801_01165 [Streptomyces sp. LP05-1]|uniref:HTH luxR-type domain-containing protein n=1 Tax=Streptomyces pyxinae TaxID=2970734 RepID=A0ABT2CAB7_9ACTN|nr:LuxR family transcriptional regulator [Streptomyces sp. LP05-1]MCS0634298.1 hypothetical protein [Streptomyces sp. LP05-1]